MMRAAALLAGLALTLGACATAGPSRYQEELDRLADACRARGGVLTPRSTPPTGNPGADNACYVPGGRITR